MKYAYLPQALTQMTKLDIPCDYKKQSFKPMKKIQKIVLFLIITFSFYSCENVIQVKLDKGNPLITVDAFVNDMRLTQKIRLTYTDDYFSNKKKSAILGATVNLKDLTTGQTFNFSDSNNGDYVFNLSTTDTIARIDHDYALTIIHNGITFSSSGKMNRTAQVDSLDVTYKEANIFREQEGYEFKFIGFDPPGEIDDYYWIKSYRNGVYFEFVGINLAINGAYGPEADGFKFIPPIAENITPPGAIFKKLDVCRVEIHSINKDTYKMLTQIQAQTTNTGLFATTPENIKSNILSSSNKFKVVGWFCMSSVGVREKIAQ